MANNDLTAKITIDGDASGAQKAAADTEKGFDGIAASAQRTKGSADQLNASFAKLGIRSAAQIDADIQDVNRALLDLARNTSLSGSEFDRAFAAGQAKVKQLRAELDGASGGVEAVRNRADGLLSSFTRLAAAFSGLELARQFVTVAADLENVERSFVAVTGSVEAAAREMAYARDVAARLGLEQISTAKAYASLMASTKGTAVEGEKSRAVFEGVARAMSLAGKSAADTEGALLAVQQMASKGVVSMEELRGQLGERLPGALNATADGLGITTAQLIELVEAGNLTAEEVFPALSAGLAKLYKDASTETLTQEWNHFKTAVQDTYETIGDAGVVDALKGALKGLSAYLNVVSVGIVALGQKIGVFFAALRNGDIGFSGFSESARQAFDDIERAAQDKLLKAAEHNDVLAGMMGKAGEAARQSARDQGEAATVAAGDWTKLNVAYGTVEKAGAEATKQALAHAEATKASGQASVESANVLGSEAERYIAKADAAQRNADALAQVAERRREELAMVTAHVAALQLEADANGGASESQQKIIDALTKTAEARQIDTDKAAAQAQSASLAAVQAGVEAAAYDNARGALSQWSVAKQQQLSVDQAGIRLAIEQQRTIIDVARAKGDEYTAVQALIKMKQLEIQLAELVARAKTAEANATLLSVQAQRQELEAKGLLTEAKKAELAAMEAGAKVKQLEAQIAAETASRMRDLADAYQITGSAAVFATGHIAGIGNAAMSSVPGVEALRSSLSALNAAEQAEADMRAGISSGMNTNTALNGGPQSRTSMTGIAADPMAGYYRAGASIEEAKAAQKYYAEFYRRNEVKDLSGGFSSYDDMMRRTSAAIEDAIKKSLAAGRQELASGSPVDIGQRVEDLLAQKSATTKINSFQDQANLFRGVGNEAASQVVRVDLRTSTNQKQSVNVASQADAKALIDTLQQIQFRTG